VKQSFKVCSGAPAIDFQTADDEKVRGLIEPEVLDATEPLPCSRRKALCISE